MVSIPLFTSIPAKISRLNRKGEEIGETYQRMCIESWKRAGFEPISVNSISEACSSSIRVISVSRDASAITGRPHVFLTDLLAVASIEARGRPFVLMNADLLIPPTTALVAKVAQLRAGEFIFSRRIDVDQLGQMDGVPFYYGYDFFAGHADDISGLPDSGMVFGVPWWDHFLPLMMFMQGCHICQTEPVVLHLDHTGRWNEAIFEIFGQRFVAESTACFRGKTYRSRFEDAVKGRTGHLLSDLKYHLWKRLPKNAADESYRLLCRVAGANLSFLDEMSLTQDPATTFFDAHREALESAARDFYQRGWNRQRVPPYSATAF
jgi:hypothetical protein